MYSLMFLDGRSTRNKLFRTHPERDCNVSLSQRESSLTDFLKSIVTDYYRLRDNDSHI